MKFNKIFLIICFALFSLSGMQSLYSQERSSYFIAAKSIGFLYSSIWLSSFVHELGHALTAYYLYGNPIKITMGVRDFTNDQPLLKLPFLKIQGLSPFQGFTKTDKSKIDISNESSWKLGIVAVAGPIAGMLTALTALKILNSYNHTSKIDHFINEFILIYIIKGNFLNLFPLIPIKDRYTEIEIEELRGVITDGDLMIASIIQSNDLSAEQQKRLKNIISISVITLAGILFCKQTFDAAVRAFN